MTRYTLSVRIPFLCAALALLGMGVYAKRGWLDWQSMAAHNEELNKKIEAAATRCDELEKQIYALEHSPFAQEQAIRQSLGYLRRDEIVIELP